MHLTWTLQLICRAFGTRVYRSQRSFCARSPRALFVALGSLGGWLGAASVHAQPPGIPQQGATPEARLAISEFHATWQTAWFASENYRRSVNSDQYERRRHLYRHCHAENFLDRSGFVAQSEARSWGLPEAFYSIIKGGSTAFGVCPTWLRSPTIPWAQDESHWRDGALLLTHRESIARARRGLINELSGTLNPDGSDAWLRGQLARLLIDARDFDGALSVANGCSEPSWWCAGLKGMSHLARGDAVAVDSAFSRMRRTMTRGERCAWDALADLVAAEDRAAYVAVPCSGRDALNERIWWLADPLFRIAGNERRAEQESRRMHYAVRASVLQDERYSYDPERGGDAIAAVLARYGWPVYSGWGGTIDDRSHTEYLAKARSRTVPAPPYSTFEYTLDAVSTIPSWRIIASPFEAADDAWGLHPEDPSGSPTDDWWPQEHYRPARRLVQLPNGQLVFIRRQNQVEVAAALRLSHPTVQRGSHAFDVMLLASPGPSRVDSIAATRVPGGSTAYLRGFAAPGPTLLAVEAIGIEGALLDARTRAGTLVPAPLSALGEREIAISDIALLSPLPDSALRNPSDELLQHMLPATRLTGTARQLVLYWEMYGVRPADSASTLIRIVSSGETGVLRRLGVIAGLASDPRRAVGIEWKDQEPRGNTATLSGPLPVQMRTLQLNLGALEPGPYIVDVTVRLTDGRTTSRQASVLIEK